MILLDTDVQIFVCTVDYFTIFYFHIQATNIMYRQSIYHQCIFTEIVFDLYFYLFITVINKISRLFAFQGIEFESGYIFIYQISLIKDPRIRKFTFILYLLCIHDTNQPVFQPFTIQIFHSKATQLSERSSGKETYCRLCYD